MAATDRTSQRLRGAQSPAAPVKVRTVAMGLGLAATLIWASSAAAQMQDQTSGTPPIDALHSALHLSSGQEGAWRAYRAVVIAPNKAQGRRQAASQMFPNLNAPQRMDLVEAESRQELVDLERQSQALKMFYATLSAEQRSVFDAQTLPPQQSQQQGQ